MKNSKFKNYFKVFLYQRCCKYNDVENAVKKY